MRDQFSKLHDRLRVSQPFQLEAKAVGEGRIEGFASTYGIEPDRHGDIVKSGAFTASLARHRKLGTMPAMLWAHRQEMPIGHWLEMSDEAEGLKVVGQLNLATDAGKQAFAHAVAGDVRAFSIGYAVAAGGRTYVGNGVWQLTAVDLVEVSLVSTPANENARVTSVKHLASKAEAVEFLRSAGMAKEAARRFAAGGFPALDASTAGHEQIQKMAAHLDAAINRMRMK